MPLYVSCTFLVLSGISNVQSPFVALKSAAKEVAASEAKERYVKRDLFISIKVIGLWGYKVIREESWRVVRDLRGLKTYNLTHLKLNLKLNFKHSYILGRDLCGESAVEVALVGGPKFCGRIVGSL